APLRIEYPGGRVGRIALGGDAGVPVPGGRRRRLGLDHAEPRVLAWRLVEMAVQAERAQRMTDLSSPPGAADPRGHRATPPRPPRDRGAPRGRSRRRPRVPAAPLAESGCSDRRSRG